MDAIKKNRFWILLGLAVPMILYGYMAANASLREATAKREDEIKKVESSIPPSSKPNGRFAEGLKAVNEKHKAQVDAALGGLWGEQTKLMVWPSIVASRIPKTYRGEILLAPRFAYKNEYPSLWEKLFYSLEPMVPETIQGTTHTQKVFVEPSALSVSIFPVNQPPVSEDVWDAQEDLWLMQMLADAIRTTNKYADGPTNATVRSIEAFKLLGGSGTAVPKAATGAAMGSGGADAMASMPMGPTGGGPSIVSGGALIDPAEEFGPDVDGASAGGGADMMSASMPSSGGAAAVKRIRYIGESDKEFKERGFYLRVVISQMKIPEFLTTLTNCPWPVRIVRFNMSPNPHEKAFVPGSQMGPESYPMAGGGYEGAATFGANPFAGGSGFLPEGGSPGGYDTSGYGGGGGGISSILAADAAGAANIIPGFVKVPDKFGALQHPDLIQLDVLGAITLYNPPATDAAAEAAPMETAPTEGAPADPMATTTPSAEPTAGAAADPMAATSPPAPPTTPAEGTPTPTPTADPATPAEPATPGAEPAAPPAPAAPENPGTSAAPPPSN